MSLNGDRNLNKSKPKRRYQERSSATADWGSISADVIKTAVVEVSRTGCAIRFGYSRDLGAYAVGVVGDGDPYTIWGASEDEIVEKLTNLAESFAG